MAPVYSNPPHDSHTFQLDDKKEHQLLNSSQDQRMINLEESQQYDRHQVDHGGSSDLQVSAAYSSNKGNKMNDISNQKLLPLRKREVGEGSISDNGSYSSSAKWMPSKMRLMQKLMNSSSSTTTHIDESVNVMQKLQCHDHHQLLHDDNNEVNSFSNCSNTAIRVCSDCNTTTTPLWRSGPRGPKSLCNACGIRKRKARRAMEAAAAAAGNGTTTATDGSFTKIKLQIKDKKPRTSHVSQYKKQCKSHESDPPPPPHHHQYQSQRKLCFKDFALSLSNNSALKQVFAQDVEEAAILLMELSCGFIPT